MDKDKKLDLENYIFKEKDRKFDSYVHRYRLKVRFR